MILCLFSLLLAEELRVFRSGDSIEALAGPDSDQVRQLNGLGPGEQPIAGTVLRFPGGSERSGVVLSLRGSGSLRMPQSAELPLELGQDIPPGTLVCTAPDSYATLRLATSESGGGHDEVTLLGGTCLVLTGSTGRGPERSSLLDLQRGYLSVRPTLTDPGRVAVRTGDGLTAGEEGGFRVAVEEGATRTEALYRPVAVIGAGVELSLKAGEGSRVSQGQAPSPVHLLPPFGEPLKPADQAPLRRPDFSWTPVERALGYRLEISSDDAFTSLLLIKDVGETSWFPP